MRGEHRGKGGRKRRKGEGRGGDVRVRSRIA
jgi:hypothetical protein